MCGQPRWRSRATTNFPGTVVTSIHHRTRQKSTSISTISTPFSRLSAFGTVTTCTVHGLLNPALAPSLALRSFASLTPVVDCLLYLAMFLCLTHDILSRCPSHLLLLVTSNADTSSSHRCVSNFESRVPISPGPIKQPYRSLLVTIAFSVFYDSGAN